MMCHVADEMSEMKLHRAILFSNRLWSRCCQRIHYCPTDYANTVYGVIYRFVQKCFIFLIRLKTNTYNNYLYGTVITLVACV